MIDLPAHLAWNVMLLVSLVPSSTINSSNLSLGYL